MFHKFDPEHIGKLRNNFYKATRLFRKADNIINIKFKGYATSIYSNGIDLAVKRILFENFEKFKDKEPKGKVASASKPTLKVGTAEMVIMLDTNNDLKKDCVIIINLFYPT